MKSRSSRILLGIFVLSVSLTQLIELGHEVLHAFKNPIHYHKTRKHKDIKDHSLKDHDFPKMKFAHEMNEPQTPNNFIALAYVFIQPFDQHDFSRSPLAKVSLVRIVEHDYVVYHSPPTPPPLVTP